MFSSTFKVTVGVMLNTFKQDYTILNIFTYPHMVPQIARCDRSRHATVNVFHNTFLHVSSHFSGKVNYTYNFRDINGIRQRYNDNDINKYQAYCKNFIHFFHVRSIES